MKKVATKIIIFILLAAVCMALTGCGSDLKQYECPAENYESIKTELKDFLAVNGGNRTSQTADGEKDGTDGEEVAADYIYGRLTDIMGGSDENLSMQHFDVDTDYGDTFNSQNVICSFKAPAGSNPDEKKIIMGCHYDNSFETVSVMESSSQGLSSLMSAYSSQAAYISGTGAAGAVESGTSVATLLSVASDLYAGMSALSFDIDIVFYGMGSLSINGSHYYYNNMTTAEKDKIALVINLDELGGDYVYTYFDEVSTGHGKYIMDKISGMGYGDYVSESDYTAVKYLSSGQSYYTSADVSNNAATYFGERNVMSVRSGGSRSFFNLYETENDGYSEGISGTSSDKLDNLLKRNENLYSQLYMVKNILSAIASDTGLSGACDSEGSGTGDESFYGVINNLLYLYIALAVLGILLCIGLILITKHLEKKYPYEPPKPGKVKIDVFSDFSSDGNPPEDPFGDFGKK